MNPLNWLLAHPHLTWVVGLFPRQAPQAATWVLPNGVLPGTQALFQMYNLDEEDAKIITGPTIGYRKDNDLEVRI